MADIIQKHLESNDTAALEADLVGKEIGISTEDKTLVVKTLLNDIYHIPSEEALIEDTGASKIGVAQSDMSVLTGDIDLQNVIEQIDDQLATYSVSIFSIDLFPKTVSTDNSVLLDSDISSHIRVVNASTGGAAASFTVGMKAGERDGQICIVRVGQSGGPFALEINSSVAGSATILTHAALPLQIGTSLTYNSVIFCWSDPASAWEQFKIA